MFTWLTLAGLIGNVFLVSTDVPEQREIAVQFGSRLAARRNELALTQEALAHRIGISRNQLQNIEQGWSDRAKRTPANPRLSTLLALCRELDGRVTIDVTTPLGVTVEFGPIGSS